jgi:hypothetical protein
MANKEYTNGGSWKKYFKIPNADGQMSPIPGRTTTSLPDSGYKNYQSRLPEVYTGHPNRIERYNQYESMDQDSEVNAALDILAEFCTQENIQNKTPFEIKFTETPTDHEVELIKKQLQQWVKLNKWDQRAFKMFRNTLKYGDQIFLRDPETFELNWVDMTKLTKVIVNESEGKEPEQYVVRDLNPNFQNMTVTQITVDNTFNTNPQISGGGAGSGQPAYAAASTTFANGGRFNQAVTDNALDAKHVVHLSLTEGLDVNWPFGTSVLEMIFKVFKQKELLEDAIIIYRIQRAPERRMFKIDVGNMPSHMAMAFVDRIKNEIHQRRIPTQNGGGQSMMDSTYNPLSINEDFFFPQTADGRGSSVEVLPGGSNLGEIDDLRFFTNKILRGLRIPASYLPTGQDDGNSGAINDGKVGTALIQEFRFNQYCKRLQRLVIQKLDDEFKMFMRWRGFNIDNSIFSMHFTEPQNFAHYRMAELDASRISSFTSLEQTPYLAKRFLMKRYLGLTEEEILENETLWNEEQDDDGETTPQGSDMRGVGVTPSGIEGDMGMMPELDDNGEEIPDAADGADLGAGEVPADIAQDMPDL